MVDSDRQFFAEAPKTVIYFIAACGDAMTIYSANSYGVQQLVEGCHTSSIET